MAALITQSHLAEWREEPITDQNDQVIGTVLKPYSRETGEEAAWAAQEGSQDEFLACPVFECLYSGTRGNGKTACLLSDFGQFVDRGYGPNWKGIVFRHTYKELQDVVDKSRLLFPKIWPGAVWHDTKMRWTWPTGEYLLMSYLETDTDYLAYHGKEFAWIGFEELTTWANPTNYLKMISCCRSTMPGMPRHLRSTTNPYGPGFQWVKERFQLPLAPGVCRGPIIRDPEKGNRIVILGDLRENKVLLKADPGYLPRLRASAQSEAEVAAWIHGSWEYTLGGMFDDLWAKVHHAAVVDPFPLPATWRVDTSFDWGQSKPFSVGWWAVSDGTDIVWPNGKRMRTVRGDLFRIKEWYGWDGKTANTGCRMLARDISKGIVKRQIRWGIQGRVRRGVADASIFDNNNGNCIATDMSRPVTIDGVQYPGVLFDPADKSSGTRHQGWEQIRKMLANVLPETPGQPREHPGLFVTRECSHFLRTVPSIPRDRKDPDDVDTDAEDHVADETRYRCRLEYRQMSGTKKTGA